MLSFVVPQQWTEPHENRECGNCYACCVYLGIEELKKYSGQTCKHLSGGADPCKRCSIYESRPVACSGYHCMWRAGWGPDEMRPYDSGILITVYPSERDPEKASATVQVFDKAKAQKHINQLIGELVVMPIMDQVRLIFLAEKRAIMFWEGGIYRCKLLPADGYEALRFATDLNAPMGRYRIEDGGPRK